MKNKWIIVKREEVEKEFFRLVKILIDKKETELLVDLVPFCNQHNFVQNWHEKD